jgi:hypothetical protein
MKGGGYGGTSANLSNQPVDLSPYQAVEFYLKGKGQYRLTLGQASIADYDYYATKDPFDAPATWTKMRIEIPDLKQGGWGAPRPFTVNAVQSLNFPVQVAYWPDIVSASYNAMIAPVTNFSIAGVLWYQGEANTGRAAQYQPLLSHLITSWREDWGRKFPFLIIQLPNFMATQANPSESQWAELREAQRLTSQAVPQTGLITTIDLGDANTIHPKNKTDVGKRVALAGLGMAYHRSAVYSGPTFFKAQVKAGKMILIFNNLGRGLKSKDNEPLKGFALAGIDHIFHWANAEIKGKTVVVWSDQIPAPTKVRYAWADNPVCNLYNLDGLPASPFQFSFPEKPGPKTEMDDIPPPP